MAYNSIAPRSTAGKPAISGGKSARTIKPAHFFSYKKSVPKNVAYTCMHYAGEPISLTAQHSERPVGHERQT
jgi:hypothetical protein